MECEEVQTNSCGNSVMGEGGSARRHRAGNTKLAGAAWFPGGVVTPTAAALSQPPSMWEVAIRVRAMSA